MKTEYEAKFLGINKKHVVQDLISLGAELVHKEILMKRAVFFPLDDLEHSWIRVRDEGHKVTMSYKQMSTAENIEGVKETELEISSFEDSITFLESIGLERKSYQETKRMRLRAEGIEFDIDTWPGLDPYIEIEGESEEIVRKWAEKLGFSWDDAVFGGSEQVYAKKYNVTPEFVMHNREPITFESRPKELT